jgi:hypothetical protein
VNCNSSIQNLINKEVEAVNTNFRTNFQGTDILFKVFILGAIIGSIVSTFLFEPLGPLLAAAVGLISFCAIAFAGMFIRRRGSFLDSAHTDNRLMNEDLEQMYLTDNALKLREIPSSRYPIVPKTKADPIPSHSEITPDDEFHPSESIK